jgi:hypothetical protein
MNLFLGQSPNIPVAKMFNLSKEHWDVIENLAFSRVQELALGSIQSETTETKAPEETEVKGEEMKVEKDEDEDVNIVEPQEAPGKRIASISKKGKI